MAISCMQSHHQSMYTCTWNRIRRIVENDSQYIYLFTTLFCVESIGWLCSCKSYVFKEKRIFSFIIFFLINIRIIVITIHYSTLYIFFFFKKKAIGFVPHLKEILTRMIPTLSIVKQDHYKWVFCACFGRFAEAIIQYQG